MYDLDEQEKIDAIKAFWNDYGKLISGAVLVLVMGFGGNLWWKNQLAEQNEKASVMYEQLLALIDNGSFSETDTAHTIMTEKYPNSSYTMLSSLIMAKIAHNEGQFDVAENKLKWVLENTDQPEIAIITRLRLSGLYLDLEKYQAALDLLEVESADGFEHLYFEMRGDILVSSGQPELAKKAYESALDKGSNQGIWTDLVQLKRDALGKS